MSKTILIPGVNFSGSSGSDSSDAYQQLNDAELNQLLGNTPNQIIDSFDSDTKGTKVNTAASLDALRLTGSNLTGSYQRDRIASAPVSNISGIIVASLQALAPKNTTIAANVIKFSGDVTAFFPTTKAVLIAKKVVSDGETIHKFISDSDGNIAQLIVSASSYNSGLDETSITITNPQSLDLDLDVIAANYNSTLRVIPFDWTVQAKTLNTASLETLRVTDAFGTPTVNITGENTFKEVGALTSTAIAHAVKFSPNGQYGILRVLEKTSGNHQYTVFGTSDGGNTWVSLGTKTAQNQANTWSEEIGSGFQYSNNHQIVVADNGKWFSCYWFYSSFAISATVRGVYGDLTSSTFLDSAATSAGVPGGRPGGTFGAGIIADGGNNRSSILCGDTADLSMVGVLQAESTGTSSIVFFSSGGATHFSTVSVPNGAADATVKSMNMAGSSGSHRVWVSTTGTGNSLAIWYHQESDSFQAYFSAAGVSTTMTVMNANGWLTDNLVLANNRIALTYYQTGYENICFRIVNNAVTGTPSISAENNLSGSGYSFSEDNFIGWSALSPVNWFRTINARLHFDGTKLIYATDMVHPDAIRRPHVWEIRDVDSYQGMHIHQGSNNVTGTFRDLAGFQSNAQTFTATSSRVRSLRLRVAQVGVIPDGHSLICEIQATTAGAPNGTVITTSVNSINPRYITKDTTNGQQIFFNFDSPTLTNATVYAFVLKSTFPINASNYLSVFLSNANPYAGGSRYVFDGTTWTNQSGNDFSFTINGEWVYDHSEFTRSSTQDFGVEVWSQETQIKAIDSTNTVLRLATRRTPNVSAVARTQNGHPMTKLMTLGSAGAASTFSSFAVAGFSPSNYDQNVVFSVDHGSADSARIVTTTGVVSTVALSEERSGFSYPATYTSIDATNYISDSSFSTGRCVNFNGTDESITYLPSGTLPYNLSSNYPFCIEAEFNMATIGTVLKGIVAQWSGASTGWYLGVNNTVAGRIEFYILNSGAASIGHAFSNGGVIVANTTYTARVTYDGLGGAPKIFLSTTGPNGTFTEITYAGSSPFSGASTSTESIWLGRISSGNYTPAKIGPVKIAKGAASINYTGYKSQPPLVGIRNLGFGIVAENKLGQNDSGTAGVNFDNIGFINPGANQLAVVDSNDIVLQFNQQLINPGSDLQLKVNMNRNSIRNTSSVQGLNFRYSK